MTTIIQAIASGIAKLLDMLKAKNPVIFVIVQSILVGLYSILSQGVDHVFIPDLPFVQNVLEIGALVMVALVGSRTVTDLPEDFDPSTIKERLAKILDSFKTSKPIKFAAIQTFLLTAFAVLTYGGLGIDGIWQSILQGITVVAMIFTGSRT